MNARGAFNRPRGGSDERARVEAAGGMHATNACTTSLENAQPAFSTAPTRKVGDMVENRNLLPRSPDSFVTTVAVRSIPDPRIPNPESLILESSNPRNPSRKTFAKLSDGD
jgi:hypothetical protein